MPEPPIENGWTLRTLKEFVERIILENNKSRDALRIEDDRRFEEHHRALAEALALKSMEIERRLAALNNAHARAEKVATASISRESWELSWKDLRLTVERLEKDIASRTLDATFQSYRAETSKALILREGQSRGVGMSAAAIIQFVSVVASIAAVISVIVILTRIPS